MKICLVGHNADALRGSVIGGSEKQIALLGKHLAKRGHEVTFVIVNSADNETVIYGVTLRVGWLPRKNSLISRNFADRGPFISHVLKEVNADIYYARGFSVYAPTMVGIANKINAMSVIGLAHDKDLEINRTTIATNCHFLSPNGKLAAWYYRLFALKRARWIISQTEEQAARCHSMSLPCCTIPNMIEDIPENLLNEVEEMDAIWVGAFSQRKGIQYLLNLISILPEVHFYLIGALQDQHLTTVRDNLQRMPNVTLLSHLPYKKVLQRISNARILINVSLAEGFSNTMLEAWALGKPVVTLTVNPNNLLAGPNSLGYCAKGELCAIA